MLPLCILNGLNCSCRSILLTTIKRNVGLGGMGGVSRRQGSGPREDEGLGPELRGYDYYFEIINYS